MSANGATIARVAAACWFLFWVAAAHADADFTLIVRDSAGEGFNSTAAPDPVSRRAGNPGDTLGAQRIWAFQQAAEYWGRRLDSDVVIQLDVAMKALSCDAYSATLGFAGTTYVFRDWVAGTGSAPPAANTWYPSALADRIAARDLDAADGMDDADIQATFNKSIDDNSSCLDGVDWFYAPGDAPPGTISFFRTVLHEIGHGLGMTTFVNLQTGEKATFGGDETPRDDAYMRFLEDASLDARWPGLSDSGRAASATDADDLIWTGGNVSAATGGLSAGLTGGEARMYAPSTLDEGSSVSHWDTDLATDAGNDELMEPFATANEVVAVSDELLTDIGWNAFEGDCAYPDNLTLTNESFTGETTRSACLTLTTSGSVVVQETANTTFEASDSVTLGPGFSVESGANFSVEIDPLLTLR